MHPTLRQVPPSVPLISTQAVLRPICPALMAATYPPGPPPKRVSMYEYDMQGDIRIVRMTMSLTGFLLEEEMVRYLNTEHS